MINGITVKNSCWVVTQLYLYKVVQLLSKKVFEIYNQCYRKVFLIGNVIYNVFCQSKEQNAFAKTRLFFGERNFLQGLYTWVHKVRFSEYIPVSLLQRMILVAGSQNSCNDHFLSALFFLVEVFLKIYFYVFVSKQGYVR